MIPQTAQPGKKPVNMFGNTTVSTFGRGKYSMDRSTLAGTAAGRNNTPAVRTLRPFTIGGGIESLDASDPQNFLSEGYMKQRKNL